MLASSGRDVKSGRDAAALLRPSATFSRLSREKEGRPSHDFNSAAARATTAAGER